MDEHRTFKKVAKGVAIGGGVVTAIAAVPIAMGFGGAGIVAGSAAAGIQSIIGNVTAGGIFATFTSLGMTGTFTTTAVSGGTATFVGSGANKDFFVNLIFRINPEKDTERIREIINKRRNPNEVIELIQYRKPNQREKIREAYNKVIRTDFDQDILGYIPNNQTSHMSNLLLNTDDIIPITQQIRNYTYNQPFSHYFNLNYEDEQAGLDARLIRNVILFNDNPLIIIRLIEFRNDEERVKIDKEFRRLFQNVEQNILFHIINYIGPNNPEVPYLHRLLENIR